MSNTIEQRAEAKTPEQILDNCGWQYYKINEKEFREISVRAMQAYASHQTVSLEERVK